jgi:hypothetical protein
MAGQRLELNGRSQSTQAIYVLRFTFYASPRPYIILKSVSAISLGVAATPMPAALNA